MLKISFRGLLRNKFQEVFDDFMQQLKMLYRPQTLSILGLMLGLSLGINAAAATSATELIGVSQNLCDVEHGYSTFTKQVACIKSQIASTTHKSDPHVQLYVFTADKLVDDVEKRRLSSPAARLELQKVYLEIARNDIAAASIAAENDRLQRAESDRKEREQRAIQNCISRAFARVLSVMVNDSSRLPQVMIVAPNREAVEGNCVRDPRWFEVLPVSSKERVSQCEADGVGGLTCRAE